MNYEIYTDGSCRQTKIGGYGFIVVKENEVIKTFIRRELNTTNQRCELLSLIKAFEYIEKEKIKDVTIFSDSAYCLNASFDKWYIKWEENGFRNAKGEPVKNKDLWEQLIPYYKKGTVNLKKVKGHSTNYYNNYIDSLVTTISDSRTKDITGEKFGTLTCLGLVGNKFTSGQNVTFWECQCECGALMTVSKNNLIHRAKERKCNNCKTNAEDLTNLRFGFLEPIEMVGLSKQKYALWKCFCHNCGSYIITESRTLKKNQSCGCVKSKGEYRISQILSEKRVPFLKEYSFDDLKNKQKFRFDFAIFNKKQELSFLLEYHGIQHFQEVSGWSDKKHLKETQVRDKIKREYCKNKKIPLLSISFEDYNLLSWDYLLKRIQDDFCIDKDVKKNIIKDLKEIEEYENYYN